MTRTKAVAKRRPASGSLKRKCWEKNAIREIKKYQREEDKYFIPVKAFRRVVKEVFEDVEHPLPLHPETYPDDEHKKHLDLNGNPYESYKITKGAFTLLHRATEDMLTSLFEKAVHNAIHAGRVTLKPTDLILVARNNDVGTVWRSLFDEARLHDMDQDYKETFDKKHARKMKAKERALKKGDDDDDEQDEEDEEDENEKTPRVPKTKLKLVTPDDTELELEESADESDDQEDTNSKDSNFEPDADDVDENDDDGDY